MFILAPPYAHNIMNTFAIFGLVILALASILVFGVIFFSYLKHLKKRHYPTWKFPDYVSVGYAEYLYHKFIKRDLRA
jgi:hypothetical protein